MILKTSCCETKGALKWILLCILNSVDSSVYKLVQEDWIEGVHYHKPTGRVIAEKEKIDDWVNNYNKNHIDNIINK